MLKASQRLMKRAALSAESLSRMPASCFGWLATIPTGWPPKRARQVISVFANFGLMSNHSPSSTISRITSYMSYGWRDESGTISSSFSDIRSSGSPVSATGGFCSQLAGKKERYCLTTRMHSSSSATSRSPTPDLRQWTLAPPRSSIEISSPVTALIRWGPASAIAPCPETIGTKSERAGM